MSFPTPQGFHLIVKIALGIFAVYSSPLLALAFGYRALVFPGDPGVRMFLLLLLFLPFLMCSTGGILLVLYSVMAMLLGAMRYLRLSKYP